MVVVTQNALHANVLHTNVFVSSTRPRCIIDYKDVQAHCDLSRAFIKAPGRTRQKEGRERAWVRVAVHRG